MKYYLVKGEVECIIPHAFGTIKNLENVEHLVLAENSLEAEDKFEKYYKALDIEGSSFKVKSCEVITTIV